MDIDHFKVQPGKSVKLKDWDPENTIGADKEKAREALARNVEELSELQYLLYAENSRALLVILQGMDTSGKDGVIRDVFSRLNPQGCKVTSFKAPSAEELDHDFLWRVYQVLPAKGDIGVFNRSHYEDVLIVRVHSLISKDIWAARYDQINAFEKLIHQNGITILKFFLHISKDEQKERLKSRLENPQKNWKLSRTDFEERKLWNDYMKAYEDALEKCSTAAAPWYIIPANKKWYRNWLVSEILLSTLRNLKMKWPKSSLNLSKIKLV
jgi:PPK2 family polyphosphate:nucleotide phosphotransferase